jgi:hypothetical protein
MSTNDPVFYIGVWVLVALLVVIIFVFMRLLHAIQRERDLERRLRERPSRIERDANGRPYKERLDGRRHR